jgi:hypothetical protein
MLTETPINPMGQIRRNIINIIYIDIISLIKTLMEKIKSYASSCVHIVSLKIFQEKPYENS